MSQATRKPLLERRMREANLSGYALAKLAGLDDAHVHRARKKNLQAPNAGKLAGVLAEKLGLSDEDRLLLKAEIMGRPGNVVRAHFGDIEAVKREFGVTVFVALEILDPGEQINGNNAQRIQARLAKGGIPACVAEDVRSRIGPPPAGKVTRSESGPAVSEQWALTLDAFERGKPRTAEAIRRSGLKRVELRERAGIAKETLRKALYAKAGPVTARKVASVLAEAAGFSEDEREAVRIELEGLPKKV